MKTYIVYDPQGNERGYVRTANQNAAEKKAVASYGERSTVAYTELGPEFDHCRGFFTDADAQPVDASGETGTWAAHLE